MLASFQPVCTWSKNHIFAGGEQNVVLLIEWLGAPSPETKRKKSHKVTARDIELQIWLEPHVYLTGLHGCPKNEGDDRSLVLPLGKICCGQRKYIALEFTLKSAPTGIHEAIWLQWLYRQPPGERIRELPVQKLSLEYSRHTGFLHHSGDFYVEKHLELLKLEKVYEEADLLRRKGEQGGARELFRRHGDHLLLLAARSGDLELLGEAENMYRMSELEMVSSSINLTGEPIERRDCI